MVELFILSADTNLNHVLESKLISEFVFQEGDSSTDEEYRSGISIRIDQVRDNYYKLSYVTSHFRDYPIDTIQEEGSDFIETANVSITSKHGKHWEIKTCRQIR